VRDVIVIGAGGGGPVVAKELAARGLDVLLLEAGSRFLRPEREWSRLENDHFNVFTGSFRFGPSDRSKPAWPREFVHSLILLQIAGVGGTTLHYLGNSPRAMPGVFRDYTRRDQDAYDTAHRFPFGYRELIPYYEWVEHTLPVRTAAMGTKERAFLRGARRMGLPFQRSKDTSRAAYRPQENAILQPRGTAGRTNDASKLRYPQARGCTFCGHCIQGCFMPRGAPRNLAAKRSTDNSYVPMALTADAWKPGGRAATLIADAFATEIVTEGSGRALRARGVRWRNTRTGEQHTEEAKVVVLAAGCVESPRLWLNSDLPNPNGWVGRGLTEHDCDWVVGLMPYYTGSSKGPGSAARCDYPGHGLLEHVGVPPAEQAASLAISDSGMAGLYDNGAPVGAAGSAGVGRRVGADLMRILSHGVDRLLNINVYTDDDVEPHNRVTLSQTMPPDEHGAIPRVEVRRRARSRRTRANREFMTREAVRLLKAAGATEVYRIDVPPFILHIHSTMRMGENDADSVLDANAESRTVKRLFIGDNSALANGVGGVNPTLTTQALATRTAEKIFELYFDGSPWVRNDSPVVSTAAAVTRAVVERGL
jgi:choline dehydrogenase-like flavoprotein